MTTGRINQVASSGRALGRTARRAGPGGPRRRAGACRAAVRGGLIFVRDVGRLAFPYAIYAFRIRKPDDGLRPGAGRFLWKALPGRTRDAAVSSARHPPSGGRRTEIRLLCRRETSFRLGMQHRKPDVARGAEAPGNEE